MSGVTRFAQILVVPVVMLSSACVTEQSDGAKARETSTSASTVVTSGPSLPTTSAPSMSAEGLQDSSEHGQSRTYRFRSENNDGYAQDVAFALGAPVKAAACAPDQQRDLVVPFTLTLTNMTEGFSSKVRYEILPARLFMGSLYAVMLYSDGTGNCDTKIGNDIPQHHSVAVTSATELGQGRIITARGFLGLADFFTPNGAGDGLTKMFLSLGTHPEGDDYGLITGLTAEGAVVGSGKVGISIALYEYIVPLDGTSNPCTSPAFTPDSVTCQTY